MYIYIYIYIYIYYTLHYIYIIKVIKVSYTINRIHNKKAFRSNVSTQIRKTRITCYELLFPVIYLYLVALLDFFYNFSCVLGVGVNCRSAFSLYTAFKPN